MSEIETPTPENENNGADPAEEIPAGEGQPSGEEASTDDQGGTEDGAPESYEFTAPEGQEFDSQVIDAYSEAAKELNLSQEKAQKLLDKVSPIMAQRQIERIEAVREGWAEEAKADKEFGGDKLDENLGVAKRALDEFGTPELKAFLKESGLGNHPEIIRAFYRAGLKITPDNQFVGGRPEGKDQPRTFNDMATKLYS